MHGSSAITAEDLKPDLQCGDDWSDGPGHLAGRTTDIPELACATTYEFGVAVVAADGTAGPVIGTATASPTAACPEPQPEPGPGPSPLPPDVVVPKFTG